MDTKLTLNVDKTIIEKAKVYAKSHKVSLSHLIESYLAAIVSKSSRDVEITPLVESLSGVIDLDANFDFKKDYTDFLIEKYK
tara:strand:- start:38 stop:283 length:246 start_codon:yes stop_codon:yes gene_type:complete